MKWLKISLVMLVVASGLYYFTAPHFNTAPPSYMDEPVWYKAGEGFILYFIMRDDNGNSTSAKGKINLRFGGQAGDCINQDIPVSYSDFTATDVGLGGFKRKEVIFNFGRIKLSDFNQKKCFNDEPNGEYSIIIKFTGEDKKEIVSATIFSLEKFLWSK